jgi:hypothetical protein
LLEASKIVDIFSPKVKEVKEGPEVKRLVTPASIEIVCTSQILRDYNKTRL